MMRSNASWVSAGSLADIDGAPGQPDVPPLTPDAPAATSCADAPTCGCVVEDCLDPELANLASAACSIAPPACVEALTAAYATGGCESMAESQELILQRATSHVVGDAITG